MSKAERSVLPPFQVKRSPSPSRPTSDRCQPSSLRRRARGAGSSPRLLDEMAKALRVDQAEDDRRGILFLGLLSVRRHRVEALLEHVDQSVAVGDRHDLIEPDLLDDVAAERRGTRDDELAPFLAEGLRGSG